MEREPQQTRHKDLPRVEPASRVLGKAHWGRLLAAAFLLRAAVALVLFRTMPLVSDALDYSDHARLLLHSFPGERAYFWPPGTPYYIALVYTLLGPGIVAARLGMIALGVATVALATLVAARVTPEPRVAALAGWIAAFYPPAILMSSQTYSQNLAAFLLALLAWSILSALATRRLRWWAASGIAFGLGCLTRPSMEALAPILIVALAAVIARTPRGAARRELFVGGFAALALCAACIIPVAIYNAEHGAGYSIATNNERNFFLGNNRYTPLYKTSHLAERPLEALGPEGFAYVDGMTRENDLASRRAMMAEAMRYIGRHPIPTLLRTLNRARAFWGFDFLISRRVQLHYRLPAAALAALLVFEAGGYAVVSMFVLAGMIGGWNRLTSGGSLLLILLVIGYALPYTIAFSGGTYHFPVTALLLPFAGVALDRALRRDAGFWSALARNRRAWVAAALFVLIQVEFAYFTLANRP